MSDIERIVGVTLNWQPISMLPTIAEIIKGELADAKEHPYHAPAGLDYIIGALC